MALGFLLITTVVACLPEIVLEGAGIQVPPRDPHRMAAAIQTLLSDPE
jgi:glycosyltransferase involved in cell wall biosynthesis